VKSSLSFKSICIQFALVFSFLLVLGPFLHAHYGASKVAGFHIAGVNSVTVTSAPAFTMASFTQEDEQESAAVGVATSYARQISLDIPVQHERSLILTFFVMSVLSLQVVSFLLKPDTQSSVSTAFPQGFPPLPHAPPTFRA
jgi:hypothetical protein